MLSRYLHCCCPINKPVPSTGVFGRWVRSSRLIEVCVAIVGVPRDDAVLHPTDKRGLMDSEMCRGFPFRQHPSISKTFVARAEPVTVD